MKGTRAAMVAKGWVAEGDGPDLTVMCAGDLEAPLRITSAWAAAITIDAGRRSNCI